MVKLAPAANNYSLTVYICDEVKYIKEWYVTKTDDKIKLEISNDYYVNNKYEANSFDFWVSNEILYEKFKANSLQKRGKETDSETFIFEPENTGLDRNTVLSDFPQVSNEQMCFIGYKNQFTSNQSNLEALILPQFNNPKSTLLSTEYVDVKHEFFFFHNHRYIIYQKFINGGNPVITFHIYKLNGDFVQTLSINLPASQYSRYLFSYSLALSPSGQYFMYMETYTDSHQDPSLANRTFGTNLLSCSVLKLVSHFYFTLLFHIFKLVFCFDLLEVVVIYC